MITQSNGWKTDDGQMFATLKEAQVNELMWLFGYSEHETCSSKGVSRLILDHKDEVIAVLSMKEP